MIHLRKKACLKSRPNASHFVTTVNTMAQQDVEPIKISALMVAFWSNIHSSLEHSELFGAQCSEDSGVPGGKIAAAPNPITSIDFSVNTVKSFRFLGTTTTTTTTTRRLRWEPNISIIIKEHSRGCTSCGCGSIQRLLW